MDDSGMCISDTEMRLLYHCSQLAAEVDVLDRVVVLVKENVRRHLVLPLVWELVLDLLQVLGDSQHLLLQPSKREIKAALSHKQDMVATGCGWWRWKGRSSRALGWRSCIFDRPKLHCLLGSAQEAGDGKGCLGLQVMPLHFSRVN
jgi:hypothetical protein